jgi:hypothetical protein
MNIENLLNFSLLENLTDLIILVHLGVIHGHVELSNPELPRELLHKARELRRRD